MCLKGCGTEREIGASCERQRRATHPKGSLFFVSFLRAFLKLFPSLSTSALPGHDSGESCFFPRRLAAQELHAALTCLAAFPVRWAPERYDALGHSVPSGASHCSSFGPESWLDGRGAALVKLVHHGIE